MSETREVRRDRLRRVSVSSDVRIRIKWGRVAGLFLGSISAIGATLAFAELAWRAAGL